MATAANPTPEHYYQHIKPDSFVGEEELDALDRLEDMLTRNPEFALRSLEFFIKAPELAIDMVTFVRDNPEGLSVLNTWKLLIESQLDMGIDPREDKITKTIEQDTKLEKLREAIDKSHADPERAENYRLELRFRRLQHIVRPYGASDEKVA